MKCLKCESYFESPYKVAKFCCKSCANSYNNTLKPKRLKNGKRTKCLNCSVEIYSYPSQSGGKFCSTKCCGEFKRTQTNLRIESGKVRTPETLRTYLKSKKGDKCEICGINGWCNKPIVLQVDHIDGNADNNLPINIRLLCPNCHSQTETFCSRNRKNHFRATYKQRYRIRKLHENGTEDPN